jgi:protein-S-isoprenylcysteine O-methyltransferase Ste14
MSPDVGNIYFLAFAGVMLCWLAFALAFLLRKKHPKAEASRREPSSFIGMALQAVGFAIIWGFRRPPTTPLLAISPVIDGAIALVAVALAGVSAWMAIGAVRVLGVQWSVGARLIEGHELITTGPYALVRHPIYTAMFGLLCATGLVTSLWIALPPAIVFFSAGTNQRTRTEERLLRELFGARYDDYAERVPPLIPTFFGRRSS